MSDFSLDDFIGPLTAILGGAGLSYASNREQQKKRNALAQQMLAYQIPKANEGINATKAFIAAQDPQARRTEMDAIRQRLNDGFNSSVGAVQAFEKPGSNAAGKTSERYLNTQDTGNTALDARLKAALSNLSTINAPGEQARLNGVRFNSAANTQNDANIASRNVGNTYMNAINSAQPNRFMDFSSQLLRGLAGGLVKKKPFEVTAKGHAQNLGYAPDAQPGE